MSLLANRDPQGAIPLIRLQTRSAIGRCRSIADSNARSGVPSTLAIQPETMSKRGERIVSLRLAICFAAVALAGCGTTSFVMPAHDGAFWVTGSSAHLTGAQEKAELVEQADAYCKHRDKSAVVIASSENDATSGTLAAPGKLARATVQFRCQ